MQNIVNGLTLDSSRAFLEMAAQQIFRQVSWCKRNSQVESKEKRERGRKREKGAESIEKSQG